MSLFLFTISFLVLISISISDRRLISYLTLFVLVSFLTCSFIFTIVFVNHCQCFSLRDPGPRIRYGSGVFVLSLLSIYFYFVTGLRAAVMGGKSAIGSERGERI